MKVRLSLCVVIIILNIGSMLEAAILLKKFVEQKDMSEYCRRRVVPSVFLGREVAESSAEVLHFSRLEMPYSCSISVRTESGSNIIVVIQLKSEKSVTTSCRDSHDQLLVYEIGETFGGYWGDLPESLLRQESRNYSTYYTLKTTHNTIQPMNVWDTEDNITSTEEVSTVSTSQDGTNENYFMMEVPLVNVSGDIEIGESTLPSNDDEDLFDLIYDVTPRPSVHYDTSVIPLVQFSIWKQNDQQRFRDIESRYQLDYNIQGVTPDYRLMYRTKNHRRFFSGRPYSRTSRLNFKKKYVNLFYVNNRTSTNKYKLYNTRHKFSFQPINSHNMKQTTSSLLSNRRTLDFSTNSKTNSLHLETFLNLLNENDSIDNFRENINDLWIKNVTKIKDNDSDEILRGESTLAATEKISEYRKNTEKNISTFTNITRILPRTFTNSMISMENIDVTSAFINYDIYSTNFTTTESSAIVLNISTIETIKNLPQTIQKSFLNLKKNNVTEFTNTTLLSLNDNHEIGEFKKTEINLKLKNNSNAEVIKENNGKSGIGSLVDHESWENVVQVAPVIAGLLNITPVFSNEAALLNDSNSSTSSELRKKKGNRKKRFIQALSIDNDRPRKLTRKEHIINASDYSGDTFDSKDLPEVVELEDDEIQGRVALRYFKGYVGAAIFNICSYEDAKARHVYLFNSSRIIIDIENFTMDRMTIVMTETRVARNRVCPSAHLECQVSGVRVCVHKMNACDGVPNCGAHDIYDEDRLLCGVNVGFQYKVCLAACTFLVVLLTVLYSVHYWLKRCVPKVSQAFFVYADKSENILYLDSVMRSPTDVDIDSRLVYHSSFFDNDVLPNDAKIADSKRIYNIFKKCLNFIICKKSKPIVREEIAQLDLSEVKHNEPKRKFSFTELELRKIAPITTRNTSVQTGESLEKAWRKKKKLKRESFDQQMSQQDLDKFYKKTTKMRVVPKKSDIELKTLRALRDKTASLQSNLVNEEFETSKTQNERAEPVGDEVELHTTDYDQPDKRVLFTRNAPITTSCEIHSDPLEQKRQVSKHLRFKEGVATIPSTATNNVEDNIMEKRGVVSGVDQFAIMDLDTIEDDEATTSGGRDFMRFWGGGKNKKSKKKTRLSLHQK